jgi:outer membrane protein assembly factor BamB
VSKRGYGDAREPVDFQHSRWQTVDVYQPDLQWPLYGATEARTQAPTEIRLRPPFRLVWSRGLGQLIEFPAVVADGFAYIGNARGTIRAISMRSGKFAWSHLTPGFPRMASSPAVDGDEIVYHTMSGGVYVLDRTNGHVKWSWSSGSAIESSPIVVDGIDYFGTASGEIRARPAQAPGEVAQVSRREDHLECRDLRRQALHRGLRRPALGTLTGVRCDPWVGQVSGKIYGTPAVAGGKVFVPSVAYSFSAFSTSGRRLWQVSTGSYVYASPAVADGVVCFGAYNGVFYGVSAGSGRVLWRVPTGGAVSGAAVIVAGVAYVGSFSHRIIGVNLHTGHRLVTFPHGEYVPVSETGRVSCSTASRGSTRSSRATRTDRFLMAPS